MIGQTSSMICQRLDTFYPIRQPALEIYHIFFRGPLFKVWAAPFYSQNIPLTQAHCDQKLKSEPLPFTVQMYIPNYIIIIIYLNVVGMVGPVVVIGLGVVGMAIMVGKLGIGNSLLQ